MKAHRSRDIDYVAMAEFRYHVRRFLHFAEQAARAAGVEPQQYQALLVICGLPAEARATVGLLAERLQIRHHSAVELADRLARAGWIKRSPGDADRREVLLHLTRRGERLLDSLSQLHRRELRITAPKLIEALQSVIVRARNSRIAPQDKRRHATAARKSATKS